LLQGGGDLQNLCQTTPVVSKMRVVEADQIEKVEKLIVGEGRNRKVNPQHGKFI
jgi:hypothetical protein